MCHTQLSVRICSAQSSRGVWGHAPSGKVRLCERASEAVRNHHNHAKNCGNWSVTQAIHRMVVSQSPLPSESAFEFEATVSWELHS